MRPLRGSFRVLILFDIAERIDLDMLRGILGAEPPRREPSFKHPSPEYVRFERPPVVEDPGPVAAATGEQFQARVKYFDYGVVVVELQLTFETGWDDLVRLSNRWISAPEVEKCAGDLLRKRLERSGAAIVQPYEAWLSEDYYAIELTDALDDAGRPMIGAALLANHGGQIAQIVRGESQPMADAECQEVLQSAMSYYPNDLLVAGWVAALIYDTPDGATPSLQLLEYANSQLLEFRYYDEVLTKVLTSAYQLLEHRGGFLRRWRMAREAERLNALRLDVMELTERTDNAIKFLSDMFYARVYRAAAHRVGVTDYRNLVEEKLRTAGDLYESMVNEFHEARSFVLELLVIAILVIELVQVFRGGH
jgi:hypothetical protein